MPINNAPIIAAEMLIARLDLPDNIDPPTLLYNDEETGWSELLVLTDHDWDLVAVNTLSVTKPFLRLRILDDENDSLTEIVQQTEAVAYDGWRYKVSRESDPLGTARVWIFKLDKMQRIT